MKIRSLILGLVGFLFAALPASAQWTGCGMGGGAGIWNGALTWGDPVNIGTSGQSVRLLVNCDYKIQAFVLGGEVSKGWLFGDANTVGIKDDWAAMGRLGVLLNPVSLLYIHGGGARENVSFAGTSHLDGIKFGLGNEFRVPNSPMYLDLRYSHGTYDLKELNIPASLNVKGQSDEFMAYIKVKFGPGMFGNGKGAILLDDTPEPLPACDPKLANCKK